MKICLVTGIFPPDIGGPATYVSTLADHLRLIGWQVEVVTYSDSDERISSPFTIHKIPRNQSTLKKFFRTRRLISEVASTSNIAYVNGLLMPAASALAGKRIPKVAKIVGDPVWERVQNNNTTNQDFDEFQKSRQRMKIRVLQHLRNRSLRRMDKIIVPCDYLRKTVEAWGFGGRVAVIYNGITRDYGHGFRDLSRQDAKKHLGLNGHILLSVGRLCQWKGFDTIILSLKQLERDTNLVIVGDGPQGEELMAIAQREGLSKRVIFTGRVSHERLPIYLRAADIFILNSGYEGFPHIVLEAMAMECPVIAADNCGTPELIKDGVNGILIRKDDLSAIVNAVRRVREDSILKSSIVRSGLQASNVYIWDKTAEKTVELLESMV